MIELDIIIVWIDFKPPKKYISLQGSSECVFFQFMFQSW